MSEPSIFGCRICGRQPLSALVTKRRHAAVLTDDAYVMHCPVHTDAFGTGRSRLAVITNWNANNVVSARAVAHG